MTKLIFLGLIPVLMLTVPNVYSSVSEELSEEEKESGFYNDNGSVKYTKDRPAINPDFAPDEDCNIAYELKCIPGSQQSCFEGLEGFNNGENNVCTPIECQEGYHDVDDDETGLCYPNSEDCDDSYVMTYDGKQRYPYVFVEGKDDKGDRCANPVYLCDDESSHEICKEFLDDNN